MGINLEPSSDATRTVPESSCNASFSSSSLLCSSVATCT